MKTPVLIAARNEAEHLDALFQHMPADAEPIVIPNGCDDNTAEIAANYGAVVLEGAPEGKLPALQTGIEYLGDRAVEPFVTLDADSYPRLPETWLPSLRHAREKMTADAPAVVTGTFVYQGPDPITAAWSSLASMRHLLKSRHDSSAAAYGRNMLIDLHDEETVDDLLSMEHIWPGEDNAIKDLIIYRGGEWRQLISPLSMVVTSGDRGLPLNERLKLGRRASYAKIMSSYLEEAPEGSMSYEDFGDDVTKTIAH